MSPPTRPGGDGMAQMESVPTTGCAASSCPSLDSPRGDVTATTVLDQLTKKGRPKSRWRELAETAAEEPGEPEAPSADEALLKEAITKFRPRRRVQEEEDSVEAVEESRKRKTLKILKQMQWVGAGEGEGGGGGQTPAEPPEEKEGEKKKRKRRDRKDKSKGSVRTT